MVPVHTMGSGRPLLLLNGYAATKDDWDPAFLEALAEGHELLMPDNPGMGELSTADPPATIAGYADSAAAALDEAGIETAAVLGWSMGGFIAQQLAATKPARVEALVLLSTDAGGPAAVRCDSTVWAELTSHDGTPEEQAERLLGLILPATFVEALGPEVIEIVAAARAALSVPALSAQERVMAAWHAEPSGDRLAAIVAPALIACGSDDRVIPAANAHLLAAGLAESRVEEFAGGEHAFQAQYPARLGATISEFLGPR